MELLMDGLRVEAYQEYPCTKIGTSHGRLSNFSFEITKNTLQKLKLFMEDLETPALSLPGIPSPLPKLELLMKDLETLILGLPRIPLLPKKLELLMEDLETPAKNTPPPPNK